MKRFKKKSMIEKLHEELNRWDNSGWIDTPNNKWDDSSWTNTTNNKWDNSGWTNTTNNKWDNSGWTDSTNNKWDNSGWSNTYVAAPNRENYSYSEPFTEGGIVMKSFNDYLALDQIRENQIRIANSKLQAFEYDELSTQIGIEHSQKFHLFRTFANSLPDVCFNVSNHIFRIYKDGKIKMVKINNVKGTESVGCGAEIDIHYSNEEILSRRNDFSSYFSSCEQRYLGIHYDYYNNFSEVTEHGVFYLFKDGSIYTSELYTGIHYLKEKNDQGIFYLLKNEKEWLQRRYRF